MRYIPCTILALTAASMAIAAPVGELVGSTPAVDNTVSNIDAPKDFHDECDGRSAKCRAINGIGSHGANEFEGHLGKQEGIITNDAANFLAIENQTGLGSSVSKDGQKVKQEMQGRYYQYDQDDNEATDEEGGIDRRRSLGTDSIKAALRNRNYQYDQDDNEATDEEGGIDRRRFLTGNKLKIQKGVGARQDEGDDDNGEYAAVETAPASRGLHARQDDEDQGGDGDEEAPTFYNAGYPADPDRYYMVKRKDRSELNQGIKDGLDKNYPVDTFHVAGYTIEQQGKAVQALGNIPADVGEEAHRQFNVMGDAEQYHSGEAADAVTEF